MCNKAVGYRVNSIKATHFRIWATNTLREFIVKGFVLNDQMLKNGRAFGKDYFDELLEKIRDIRASERRAYQKITDVFQECSSDYQSKAEETQLFYQMKNLIDRGVKVTVLCHTKDPVIPFGARMGDFVRTLPKKANATVFTSPHDGHANLSSDMIDVL